MGTTPFRYRHPSIQPPQLKLVIRGKARRGGEGGHTRGGEEEKLCPTHPPEINSPSYRCTKIHTDTDTQYTYLVVTLSCTSKKVGHNSTKRSSFLANQAKLYFLPIPVALLTIGTRRLSIPSPLL
ncbi:hypothetical protein LOAG_12899, partial [Loa loa]